MQYLTTLLCSVAGLFGLASAQNSTFANPIIPGTHPDPSCIFVPELDETFFCISSSFAAFPGLPVYASRDLVTWKLASNVLSRPEQLPGIQTTQASTDGIWAPTLRHHDGTFYVTTTQVYGTRAYNDSSRWDNILFSTEDPFGNSWSDPVHFEFPGYDTSLFWDDDGTVYVEGSHYWRLWPGSLIATIDLDTGEVGELINTWNGTGGMAPEAPHTYKRDGWYYLVLAEGGTSENHMVTMARAHNIAGPYESSPLNPLLTNANTSEYFQAVGHVDLFQDASDNWWGAALSNRASGDYETFPMNRETVLTPVSWPSGEDFPVFDPVRGNMTGWPLPSGSSLPDHLGIGQLADADDDFNFVPDSDIPAHMVHWRFPADNHYAISPADSGHANTLQLLASRHNLTGYDGVTANQEGQTLLARRQTYTEFEFSVTLDYSDLAGQEDEAGVTLFLVPAYHFDIGVVMLPSRADEGQSHGWTDSDAGGAAVVPHLRFRGISGNQTDDTNVVPIPEAWGQEERKVKLQVVAVNETHYAFSAGPLGRDDKGEELLLGFCRGSQLSWGYTGTMVGVYATTNGGEEGSFRAWVGDWVYRGIRQVLE